MHNLIEGGYGFGKLSFLDLFQESSGRGGFYQSVT